MDFEVRGINIWIPEEYNNAILSGGLSVSCDLAERLFRLYKTEYCTRNSKYISEVEDSLIIQEMEKDLLTDKTLVAKKMYTVAEAEAFQDGIM